MLKLTRAVTLVATMVYLDSFLFIVISSVLRFGLANTVMTASRCKSTDIACLTVYLSTKVRRCAILQSPNLKECPADI